MASLSPTPTPSSTLTSAAWSTANILGPLTTPFTASPTCSLYISTNNNVFQSQICTMANGFADNPGCWPSIANNAATGEAPLFGYGLYSPGYYCPDGYTTAAMATQGGYTGWPIEYILTQGETAVACCPSGMTPTYIDVGIVGQTCATVVTTGTVTVSTAVCEGGEITSSGAATAIAAAGTGAYTIWAPLIQLNFKQSDIQANSSAAASRSSSSAARHTGSSSTSGTQSSTTSTAATGSSSSSSKGSSLNTGIGIGVGVGVGGAALLAIGLGIFLVMRRRRRNRAMQGSNVGGDGYRPTPSEDPSMKGTPMNSELPGGPYSVPELGGNGVAELPHDSYR